MDVQTLADEQATRALGASFVGVWRAGDVIYLEGPLGVGKTTFVRGYLEALGHVGPVRSPTFTILQTYPTAPPVVHADLYRLETWKGVGLEDLLDDHVVLIEWPDRAAGLVPNQSVWRLKFLFKEKGRTVAVVPPSG
ncbi:MAG: tRNA (adenosine(37)-N6)-threonylcarbamoyltransferase complex ATPase subunit type 1 TsaE [Armatimonadetes bacterium]|nr:tRNA (adenosine(37)-N6)-threonylcarbamoyltransferase complex ATPase subunit type 1 TsaE [Armatimonadota bacterium]